ncbi:hypothetical protein FQN57_006820 [Myotisia sp. PD_48]|nr:hypothetical protein FQN57_006820 [Myotisia sp. PD_48]
MELRNGFSCYILILFALHAVPSFARLLFPYEQEQLTARQASRHQLFAFGKQSDRKPSSPRCKVGPEDREWPSLRVWDLFNQTLGGALLAPSPIASVCHYDSGHYNETGCEYVLDNTLGLRLSSTEDPTAIMTPWLAGRTCDPTTDPTTPCTQGGYPHFVVNATTVAQMQLAINFARNANLRLVIKNTGHDFNGKSAGRGALSIWTRHMKGIQFLPRRSVPNAAKVALGVQASEAYEATKKAGVTIVGGEGATVGIAGGFVLGGGHSPLSGLYGMGADHILSLEVITADGRFVSADATHNSDLFWALSGGGPGTFGLVTSITFGLKPRLPVSVVRTEFASGGNVTLESFWKGVRAYFDLILPSVDEGLYSYFSIFPSPDGPSFRLKPFFAPKKTIDETNAILEPFYGRLRELGIEFTPNTTHHDNYVDAWDEGFDLDPVGFPGQIGSRLFPRENFEDAELYNRTFDAIRNNTDEGHILLGFSLGPTLERGGNPDNSVNPYWRNTVLHAWTGTTWSGEATVQQISDIRERFNRVTLQQWRDVAPNSGCYLNEAYVDEPNWQDAYYGSVYPRLYQIKQKYDPYGLFYAITGVGSEDWENNTPDGLPTANGHI